MDKFKNKYRITSARLKFWDYRNNGAYFITICTANREHYFGEIENGIMQLNEIGKLAEKYWMEIPKHFPFVELGNFVIMPNHTHGILIMDKPINGLDDDLNGGLNGGLDGGLDDVETLQCNVSTAKTITKKTITAKTNANKITINKTIITDNKKIKNEQMAKISPKPGSISTIIRSYKSVVSKNARKIHADFGWQSRFHDHIIRNTTSFNNIQNYITENPLNWGKDKFHG